MPSKENRETSRSEQNRRFSDAGMSVLRVTLLFGSGAVALALLLAPIAEKQSQDRAVARGVAPYGVDMMSTGSIAPRGELYTERRSVLQRSPDAVCTIRPDGSRRGSC